MARYRWWPLGLGVLLAAGCTRADDRSTPAAETATLTLLPIEGDEEADCTFASQVDAAPVLRVTHDRARTRGRAVQATGLHVELTGTSLRTRDTLPVGVQLEGAGLTVAVQPDRLPGVPVGVTGVRRAAVLTAATPDGGTVVLDGVWSCRFGR